jgi:hypothetical protein
MKATHSSYIQTVFAQRGRAASLVLSICLALAYSPSCSRQEKTAESEAKEPAPAPPAGAMKLSDVLKSLESAGYAPVVEVEFEKDHWDVKAYSKGQLLQLKTDLTTGALIPDAPPKLDKPLSEIVKGLEDQGYGPIVDIEPGHAASGGTPAWDIEAYHGKSEVKVTVDAAGKIEAK